MRNASGQSRSARRPLLAVAGAVVVLGAAGLAGWLALGDDGDGDVVAGVITSENTVDLPEPAPLRSAEEMPADRRVHSIFGDVDAPGAPADWMTIWLRVTDELGRPCPGANLRLAQGAVAEVEPHDETTFKLRALEGTAVTVFAQAPGYASLWERVEVQAAADVTAGGASPTLVMRMHPGEWAQVLDPRGRPVPGTTVEFYWRIQRRRNQVTRGVSGPDGLVYCGYPPGRLEAAYLGETPRGHLPSPERKLAIVGRSPLTLQAPNAPAPR